MKKRVIIFTLIIGTFVFTACSNYKDRGENTLKDTEGALETVSIDGSTEGKVTNEKINIIINNEVFTAILEDNKTVKELLNLLPVTINMDDMNRNEKFYYFTEEIIGEKPQNPGKINAGDIMLYSDNCLVLFYKTFSTSYSYVKIGHIENIEDLEKVLGEGKVQVTLELN